MLLVDPCNFTVTLAEQSTPPPLRVEELQQAWSIYKPLLFPTKGAAQQDAGCTAGLPRARDERVSMLHGVTVQALPLNQDKGKDEAYTLNVPQDAASSSLEAVLSVRSYVGLLRGLETLSQLLQRHSSASSAAMTPPLFHLGAPVYIEDAPAFTHRGILLDTARNFLPVSLLKRTIDALLFSKMNILHLHLSDSQSFPLELTTGYGPNITAHGSYSKDEIYSVADIKDLIAYAKARGVTLIPEIDTPGHARAFGTAPGLSGIVSCGDVSYWGKPSCCAEPPCGQLNPSSELMYKVLGDALIDVTSYFKGATPYIHLGFDEVNFNCWLSDPTIVKFMKNNKLTNSSLLAGFFHRERSMLSSITGAPSSAIYWDEVVTAGLHKSLQPSDVVQFWHDSDTGMLAQYMKETPSTNKAIVSAYNSYYLDCGTGNEFGDNSWCDPLKTWRTIYFTDPTKGLDAEGISRVLGGEVALWTEVASSGSLDAKLWPRAAAYGGRLWDGAKGASANWVDIELGLAAHATRLLGRGIASDQIMPQFCQQTPHLCFPGK